MRKLEIVDNCEQKIKELEETIKELKYEVKYWPKEQEHLINCLRDHLEHWIKDKLEMNEAFIKFGSCLKCDEVQTKYDEKFKELEEAMRHLAQESSLQFRNNYKRLTELEQAYRFDNEGRVKINDRLDHLEQQIHMEDRITASDVLCRLTKLETSNYDERITDLEKSSIEKRLTELERFQHITHAEHQKVIKNRKPHICPNCKGSGRYTLATSYLGHEIIDCHSCNGKGIVWEPKS